MPWRPFPDLFDGVDACEVDEPTLDVDGEELDTNLIADIQALESADDAPLDRDRQQPRSCPLLGRARDQGVELLADPRSLATLLSERA